MTFVSHKFAVRDLARGGRRAQRSLPTWGNAAPPFLHSKCSGVIRQRDTDIFELVQHVAGWMRLVLLHLERHA